MKIKSAFASFAVLLSVLFSGAGANAADISPEVRSKGCVTKSEFNKVKTGATKASVARIFGANGNLTTESSGFGIKVEIRDYKGCNSFSFVSLLFSNGRMDTKSQVGL
jgi:hypothetical protein